MAESTPTDPLSQHAPRDPELVASLTQRNATFSRLLSLIPQQYYVAPTQEEMDNRWMKNKKRKTGDEIKEHKESKRRLREEKLDPSNLPTPAAEDALPPALPALAALPPTASISDLRSRMAAKLNRFKKDRGYNEDEDPQSRDALEAARRMRRGEIRDKRRKERKEERKKARVEVTARGAKTQLLVPIPKPSADDSIAFPSVALPSQKTVKAPLKKISNPSQALAHLEKHNAKIAALPEDKRKEVEERERWAKAEARAAGVKIVDEEKTLKKAVKREEKRKGKSGKEWVDRKKVLAQSQAAKIKKRTDNIAARAEARKNHKSHAREKPAYNPKSKDGKKGRPGFEGKKGGKGTKSGMDKKSRAASKA